MSWLSLLFDVFVVVSPMLPYIPQYQSMQTAQSTQGFSPFVCLVLLVSNLLRCFFWIGKRFETTLLLQSLVLIVGQVMVLELCVRVKKKRFEPKSLADGLDLSVFWAWDDFLSYIVFLAGFTAAVGFVTATLLDVSWYVELLGIVALATESGLGVPQVIENHRKGNVKGLSSTLIFSWFAGDATKTIYFLAKDAPMQFIMCGVTQLVIDCVLVWQFVTLGKKRPKLDD